MAARDPDGTTEYLRLSERYGWTLYSFLRERTADPKRIEELYRICLTEFSKCGREEDEALLLQIAQRVYVSEIPPIPQYALQDPAEKGGSFGFYLCLSLLILLILLFIWVIVGLLMELGFIPQLPLGHEWLLNLIRSVT